MLKKLEIVPEYTRKYPICDSDIQKGLDGEDFVQRVLHQFKGFNIIINRTKSTQRDFPEGVIRFPNSCNNKGYFPMEIKTDDASKKWKRMVVEICREYPSGFKVESGIQKKYAEGDVTDYYIINNGSDVICVFKTKSLILILDALRKNKYQTFDYYTTPQGIKLYKYYIPNNYVCYLSYCFCKLEDGIFNCYFNTNYEVNVKNYAKSLIVEEFADIKVNENDFLIETTRNKSLPLF